MPHKDPEERRAYHKAWSARNRKRFKRYEDKLKAKDPERWREMRRAIAKKHYHSGGKEKADIYRHAHLAQLNKARRENRFLLKTEVIQHYGGKCWCCGEKNIEFLCIDHIQGNGKKHRDSLGLHGGTSTYAWLKSHKYPKIFRVLCWNCNSSYGFMGYCPHRS